ncbi:hypothetical protein FRX31_013636 [Thalictrum thalictroides]|uniref:Uncharacterized protein n=1 Tax=Thalictrum thalictroides TaxID=46969 RepID=A0A7J6WIG5_THATH|nr:hypothetical protein FRX31_013636 [Thalictrum thalictroides]
MKLAMEYRRALGNEQDMYIQSFLAIAAAIRLFDGRHTSPSSPFLLIFHPPSFSMNDTISNSVSLQRKQVEQDEEASIHPPTPTSNSSEEENGEEFCRDEYCR